MSKVFVFGDSFSEDFEFFSKPELKNTFRYKYIHDFLNGRIPKSFGKIISEKINYEYVNRAAIYGLENEGNCNESLFNNFCLSSREMNSGDIVFYGYTGLQRMKWAHHNKLTSVLPNQIPENIPKDEKFAIEQIMVNKDQPAWMKEYVNKEILLREFCKSKNVLIFFWSCENQIYKYLKDYVRSESSWLLNNIIYNDINFTDIYSVLNKLGGKSIKHETNGEIPDDHFGESAHQVLADLFYQDIIDKNYI